jgi:hypothetical protein
MRTLALATLAALVSAGSARAEDPCLGDVERFCAGIPRGGGRIAACLKANEAQVTPACKAHLATVRRKVQEVGEACGDDVRSYCADVQPGQGNVLRCLAANRQSLAPQCQELLQTAQEKGAEFRKACGPDAKKLCKGIRPGQGRILACLESRKADLAPACQQLMTR